MDFDFPWFGEYLRHLRLQRSLARPLVAALSGVFKGHIAKLERGETRNPGRAVRDELADAVGASDAERQHVHDLAHPPHHDESFKEDSFAVEISPQEQAVADALNPHLAAYLDEAFTVLACNRAYAEVFDGITAPRVGNLLVWLFDRTEAQTVLSDWDSEARTLVGYFRVLMARRPGHSAVRKLFVRLCENPAFCDMWSELAIAYGRPTLTLDVRHAGQQGRLLSQLHPDPNPRRAVLVHTGIWIGTPLYTGDSQATERDKTP